MKSICGFSRLVLWAILPALCPSVQADTGRAVVRHAPVLNGNVEGSLQQLLGESVVANGGATITGDLFVPGTPTVTLNGRPTYGGTVDGAGGESPSGYRITLNGTCSLRHVVRRTDPVPIPTVEAPPAPQGTRSVVINSGSPGPGDFSTLRNLTLNGNVGQVAIPPGSYGNFVANGNSGFTLGIAGATEPSRYALQQLTLNGATQLNVVGPIILTLVHGFSANGDLGASSNPSWLKLNVQSGAIVLNGGASLCGYVVAPDSTVILNGNSRLIGGLVSNRLTLNGNSLLRIVEALANRPPSVVFTAPADGAVVSDTSAIVLTAAASDPDGTIAKVEFFSGPTKLGEATVAPYQCSWTNVTPGSYTLTARATDDLGEVAISDSVSIQVLAPNVPPSVSLTTPVADMVFSAPAGITLSAAATDADGSVAKVEFFNGEAKLGETTVAPYDYVWRDVASGVYVLTVRATDDAGAVGLSDPVSIRVNAHPAAVALTLTTMINTALPVILAGSDPEGDALAFSVMTPPAHGTLSGTAPALTYTPMADYAGADAFSYAVSDPYGSSEPAIVSIQVEAPVEPPTAENAALEVQVGSSAPITLQGADARGRPLTFTIVTPPALGSVQQISNEGQTSHWTYSAGSAAGLDTFTFIVSNGAQSSSPVTVKIRVLPAPPLASGTQGKAGGIVRDALTLEPLEGVTVRVEGVDGAVLSDDAGNFMLPVVNFGDETAVSEVLVYEAPGYIPAYRRVIAYPDVPVTADPVFLKKYDSKITPIGPAGGTATSAAGDVEADFPAGASSGTMAVQLTNYSAGRELPGPLPRASAFTYAVDLAPNGAAFSSPVTVKIANTLGFAPHTPVPVGVFNPETARWEPESMASISTDGQWVVFQVTHFSARDCNHPGTPAPVDILPISPKPDNDPSNVKTDPGVSVAQGTYETDIDLPGYRSIGRLHAVRLRYESTAASARRPFTIQASNGPNSASPLARMFDVDIGGHSYQSTFQGEPALEYGRYFGGALLDLHALPTGLYPYKVTVSNLYSGTYATSDLFGGSPQSDTGIATREAIGYATSQYGWMPWVNTSESPYGAGWSVEGLSRLSFSAGSKQILVVSGGANWQVFDYKSANGLYLNQTAVGPFAESSLFSLRKDDEGGLIVAHGDGLSRMTAAGELTPIVDGVSGHYFITVGSSDPILVRGGVVDGVETESGTFYLIVRLDQADPSSSVQKTGLYRVRPGSSTFESIAVDLEKPRELQVDRLSRIYVYDEATASIWRYGTDGERELVVPDIDDFRGMTYDNATNRLLFASGAGLRYLTGDDSVLDFITESGAGMPDYVGRPVISREGDVMFFGIGTDTDGNYETGLFRFGADGVYKDVTESDLDGLYERWEQTILGKVWRLMGDIQDGSASSDRFIWGLTREEAGLYRNTTHHTKRLSKHDDEWTFDDGRGDIRHYGLDGLLRSATDRNGNTTTYAYDGQGRLTAMVDPVGATTLFGYGDNGRLARIQDPIGRSTLFETDGRGDLVAVTFPDGSRRRYDYDAHHCIVKKSDGLGQTMAFSVNDQGVYSQITYADGTTTQFEAQRPQALAHSDPVPGVNHGYDADLPAGVSAEAPDGLVDANGNRSHFLLDERGYPQTEIDALGNTSSTVRDADDRIIVVWDGRGNEVNFSYDLAGNLKKTTRADGTTISTEYDPALNLPITVTDPRGHSSFFAYDADGNLIASTDALGNVTTYTYNSRGQVLSRTNALGETTRWTYDARGNPQTITDPLGAITTLTNDAAGRIIAATDPLGHTTTFAYDGFDRLLARTTADGATIHFTYDANGNRTSMTDALGQVTRYAYDATDQLVKITAPDDSETRFVYDANGNRTQIIDPLGHSLTYRYDAANRLTDVTDALGRTTHFLLDENGNRILTADPLGRTTAILYDALDRPVRTTAPDEGITTFAYDPAGNLVELTDPLRHQTTWEYDALNRVLETTDPLNRTRLASYDAAGRIATQTNGRGQVLSYAYDAAGRPRSLDLAGTESITWSYDAAGNPLRVADGDSVVDTTYDAMNRPTSVQQAYGVLGYSYDLSGRRTQLTGAAGAIDYAYDALNRLTGLTDPSARHYGLAYDLAGRLTKQTNPNATYSLLGYDAANQLSDKAHYAGSGMALGDNTYLYDAAGNVMGWGTSDGNIRAFAYDANNRLTAVQSTLPAVENESFAYDEAGNWAPFDARVHNEANEISEDSGYRYTYDLDGNLMRKESKLDPTDVTTYAWDPLNRLIQVNGGEHVVSYRYDGLGRRIAKTVDGVETRYVLDGANVVEERDASGTLTAFNLYAGLDRLLMRRDYGTGATYWTQTDHLGSVESLTDAAGTVVERYRYGSFGRLSVLAPDFSPRASAPLIPFTYTGREWEPEVGMYFFRARFMDPRLGRFISQDPIGLDGGINGYAYCGNNPVMMIDPNGMQDGMAGLAGMTGFNSAQDAYNYAQLQQINQSPTVQAAQAHAQLESLPSVTIVVGISGQGGAALPVGPAAQVTPFSIGVSLSPARGIQAGVLAGGGFGGQILASYSSTVFFQVTNASSLDALKGQGYVLGASGGEGVVIGGDVVTGWANGRPSPSSLFGGQLSIGLGGGFPVEAHAMPTYTIGLTTKQSNLLPPAHEPNGGGRK